MKVNVNALTNSTDIHNLSGKPTYARKYVIKQKTAVTSKQTRKGGNISVARERTLTTMKIAVMLCFAVLMMLSVDAARHPSKFSLCTFECAGYFNLI